MRLRDAQLGALRAAQTARLMCAEFEKRGERPIFEPSTRLIQSTDAAGYVWHYQLGAEGTLAMVRTPSGRVSHMHFDDRGRLEDLMEPSGRRTQVPCDEQGAPTRLARNGQTIVSLSSDAGRTSCTAEFCDGSRSQLTLTPKRQPLRYVNRLNHATTFVYADSGRLVELRDGKGQSTSFECNAAGLPSTTRHSDGRVESVTYLSVDTVALAVGAEPILELKLDSLRQPVGATYADGARYSYSYDDAGRLTSAAGPSGSVEYEYRDDGKLVSESSGEDTFEFEFDTRAQLATIQYPDGSRAEFTYDSDLRLARVLWGDAHFDFAYPAGDRQRILTTRRLQTNIQWGPIGKPEQITVSDPARGQVAFQTTYRYDLEGRLIAKRDSASGEERYSHDAESQLLGVADDQGRWREVFSYDAAGNRTFASGLSVEVAPGNRVRSQGDFACEYDARGNLVTMAAGAQSWCYAYDLKNQLLAVHGPAGPIEFKYDALGRRIEKLTPDRQIRYVWCGELLTREIITTGDRESVRDYLYVPGSYEPLAQRVDGRVYYYHNDHLGTPQRLTDENGQVVWQAKYYAFGHADVNVGIVENPLRLPGQYFDVETGLHYNRFRYYSPLLGRYTSVDPVGLLGGQNVYLYANNDPLNETDALGLFPWGVVGGVVTAIAVGVAAVVLAPAAVAVLATGVAIAGAAALGAAVGLGIREYQGIGTFCSECFWKGVASAAPLAGLMGLGLGAAMVLCPPLGLALTAGVIVYGTYSMFADHYGWSGGKPYDQMTDEEKSKHLGELVGGTVAGLVGGLLGGLGAKAIRGGGGTTAPVEGEETGGKTSSRKGVTKDPRTGKENTTVENDDAIVPDDKVDKFMRGKTQGADQDLNQQIRDLNQQKQQNRKAWDANPENEEKLSDLKNKNKNAQRSQDMSGTLEEAGIPDTPEENARLKQHLLEQGKKATPENREVASEIGGSNGRVKLLSTWKQLPDGRWQLATVKAIPIDGPPAPAPAPPPKLATPPVVVGSGTSDDDDDE